MPTIAHSSWTEYSPGGDPSTLLRIANGILSVSVDK
jgi:hypothetical protein